MKHRLSISVLIISIILLLVLNAEWWIFFIVFVSFISITAWGAFDIRQNYFIKSYSFQSEPNGREIAITFDDGPTDFTPKILELLDRYNAKATFFCIGKQVEKHPDIFNQIIAKDHEIGNHTFNHSNSTGFFSSKKIIDEIQKTDEEFLKYNIKTKLYRPPFGITNPNIAKAIKKLNKKSIGWNIRSLDTVLEDESKILKRILPKVKPGSIILLHDTSEKSARVLENLLLNLHHQNYRFVTVSELLRIEKNV